MCVCLKILLESPSFNIFVNSASFSPCSGANATTATSLQAATITFAVRLLSSILLHSSSSFLSFYCSYCSHLHPYFICMHPFSLHSLPYFTFHLFFISSLLLSLFFSSFLSLYLLSLTISPPLPFPSLFLPPPKLLGSCFHNSEFYVSKEATVP